MYAEGLERMENYDGGGNPRQPDTNFRGSGWLPKP
jgi:hypothetical protein